MAERTLDLSEFLVDRLGAHDVGSAYAGTLTYHPTCHSLRMLRLGDRPELLLRRCPGVDLRPLADATECCGFGGTFAVRNADVSTAMLADKLRRVEETGADAVCACDASCLLHIRGGLERRGVAHARRPPRGGARDVSAAARDAPRLPFEQSARAALEDAHDARERPPRDDDDPRATRRGGRRDARLGGAPRSG